MNIGAVARKPKRESAATCPISWTKIDATKPPANCHPQTVQYTPKASSIETTVLAFVRPTSRSFALPATSAAAAAIQPQAVRGRGAGRSPPAPTARLKVSIRSSTAPRWREPDGRRSRASRHALNASESMPAALAVSASAASRFRRSACTSRWQFGQASKASAIRVPHAGHEALPTPRLTSGGRGALGERERTRERERRRAGETPGLLQSEEDDEPPDDVLGAAEERALQDGPADPHPRGERQVSDDLIYPGLHGVRVGRDGR